MQPKEAIQLRKLLRRKSKEASTGAILENEKVI